MSVVGEVSKQFVVAPDLDDLLGQVDASKDFMDESGDVSVNDEYDHR
jgi:hypothetical protein